MNRNASSIKPQQSIQSEDNQTQIKSINLIHFILILILASHENYKLISEHISNDLASLVNEEVSLGPFDGDHQSGRPRMPREVDK